MSSEKSKWHFTPMMIIWPVVGLAGIVLLGFLFGFVVQYLWNALMPGIFSLREITYWEGFGLFILAKIFFGGFCGGKKHGGKVWKKKYHDPCGADDESHKWGKWKHYNSYWKSEGKAAFDKYVAECEERSKTSDKE